MGPSGRPLYDSGHFDDEQPVYGPVSTQKSRVSLDAIVRWPMDWKVFATAPGQLIGESWCGLVKAAGINCKLQPGDAIGFLGVSTFPVRLMVRSEDVESDTFSCCFMY